MAVISEMFFTKIKENDFVFEQNQPGESFFILSIIIHPHINIFIAKGSVQVIIDSDIKKTLHQGANFGELALLYNAPRSATIKSIGKCELWGIDRETFKKVVREMAVNEY